VLVVDDGASSEVVARIREACPSCEVIVVAAKGDVDGAVAAAAARLGGPVSPAAPGAAAGHPAAAILADLADVPYAEAKRGLVTMFDETYTGEMLRRTGNNLSEAARRAGLDRSNFRRLLKRHRDDP
jgi:DNA-binding NtrC family response regulator